VLDYGAIALDSMSKQNKQKFDSIQAQALRIASGAVRGQRPYIKKYFLNKQMSVVVRKIIKYHRYKLRYSVVTVTLRMCCSSKSVCQVATGKVFVRGTSNAAMQVDMGEPPLQRLCDIMVRSL